MEKEYGSQLEFFSQGRSYSQAITPGSNRPLFGYIRNYEKIILALIGVIVVSVVSFSLGVRKGRSPGPITASRNLNPVMATTPSKKSIAQPTAEKQNLIEKPILKEYQENFTIQLASYQGKVSAQKEAELLRKKGLTPVILAKGKYTILCVGNFSNQEKAKMLLSDLKKRYRDCFIRRL